MSNESRLDQLTACGRAAGGLELRVFLCLYKRKSVSTYRKWKVSEKFVYILTVDVCT